jgi:hypothetical protein
LLLYIPGYPARVRIPTGVVSFEDKVLPLEWGYDRKNFGIIPAVGIGKRPEKIPVWWEISLRE